jgi:uncharacterized membrane protein
MSARDHGMLWARRAYLTAALAWAFLIPVAAWAASRSRGQLPAQLMTAIPYEIGAVICHQQPTRSFFLWSRQLPVCARCTGLYVGAAVVALASIAMRGTEVMRRMRRVPPRVFALAIAPALATLAYEWTTGVVPSNVLRALTGLPLGAAVAWAILSVLDDQVN